jgi:hypothetical protein
MSKVKDKERSAISADRLQFVEPMYARAVQQLQRVKTGSMRLSLMAIDVSPERIPLANAMVQTNDFDESLTESKSRQNFPADT